MDREYSPDPVVQSPALGFLRYVDRKTGEVKQHFPLDAERITFGRDPDCDIRLHWDDVSRVHAEIQFDLLEGTASLLVVGSNGLYFLPNGQNRVKLDPSTRQTLSSGDSFIIRKKLFIFEYPPNQAFTSSILSPSILNTPVRGKGTPAKPSTSSTPLRRRASHRLSLMPADKPFVPLSPLKRRQSNAGQTGSTPKRSHLSRAAEEDEEDDVMEGIVDVQQNEDGDMIILETRDDTPAVADKPAVATPKTPRSIPLPLPAQTPYVQTPPRVPSKVAMSTPPGPMTLHKALLLRSARKAWVESRPNDVDDAVADGKIEIARRKSKSPSKEDGGESKRKSLTPRKSVAQPDSDISDDDDEEEAIAAGRAELQWVQVDPMAEASFIESDSADDSLDADISLDIPGQDVLDFGPQVDDDDASAEEQEGSYEEDEDEESFDSQKENRFEEQEEEQDLNDAAGDEEQEQQQKDLFESQRHSTPVNSRTLNRFYTPQVPRQQNQARRSLASIGGPASRAFGVPASPNPLGGGAVRSTPSKPTSTPLPSSFEEEDEEEDEDHDGMQPIQASVSDRELAEIKRRRQSLATPRQLPAAPMSFRDPIKGAFSLVKTPSHPALTRSPTKDADNDDDTPIGDIRSRLNKMKRDSSARELSRPAGRDGRRATVGFALPETPARPSVKASASYTAAPAARFGTVAPPTPCTPVVRPNEEQGNSEISAMQQTPIRSAIKKVGTPFSLIRRTPIQESPERGGTDDGDELMAASPMEARSPRVTAATPDSRAGKTSQREQPKTPYMGDIRNLYPTIPSPASPILSGIKSLYPTLPLPPKTPDMRGMKGMFATSDRNAEATPGMEGLEEMFASPARNSPARAEQMNEDGAEHRSPRVSRRSSAGTRLEREELEVQQEMDVEVEEEQHEPPARPISPIAIQTKSSKPVPSTRAPRAPKVADAAAPAVKSAPTRTRATPAVVESSAETEKPSTSTRRRAIAPPAAGADAEPRSKPSRRAPAPVPTSEAAPAEEVAVVSKPTRSRVASAKIPTKAGPSARAPSPEVRSAPAPRGRPKKVLVETADQPALDLPSKAAAASTSKSTRTRTAAAPAAVEVVKKAVSAPTRRTRAVKEDTEGEKENVAEEKPAPSRVSKARGVKKDAVVVAEPVATTGRATRSRK